MSLVLWKFYGHLASIWNRLQSCLSYLWYQKPEKQNQSRLIICLLLDLTELSTLSTGSTATTQKVSIYIVAFYNTKKAILVGVSPLKKLYYNTT